jgi:hypothetical protein
VLVGIGARLERREVSFQLAHRPQELEVARDRLVLRVRARHDGADDEFQEGVAVPARLVERRDAERRKDAEDLREARVDVEDVVEEGVADAEVEAPVPERELRRRADAELAAGDVARLLSRHGDHPGRHVEADAGCRRSLEEERGHEVAGPAAELERPDAIQRA